MSSSSDNLNGSDDEVKKGSSDSEGAHNSRGKRKSRSNKKTIESAGSSESESDVERKVVPKKKRLDKEKQIKKKPTKRKRASSESSNADLFEDAQDKARVMAMSELDKEREIFNRMERRDEKRARDEIAQKLAAKKSEKEITEQKKKKKSGKKKKVQSSDSDRSKSPASRRSGSDSEGDAEFHRPSEVYRKKKEKNAMAELKQKRRELEKKNAKNASLSIDAVFGPQESETSSSTSSASSRSSSSSRDSSPDSRHGDAAESIAKKEVEFLSELVRARLSRFKLVKFLHAPFFAETVNGCYIRVGHFENEGKHMLWEITEVIESNKVYPVDDKRTNKNLKCRFGRTERTFSIKYVSNSEFLEEEFREWQIVSKAEGLLPTMDFIEKKEAAIKKAMNYSFADHEIDALIKEKARFEKVPKNFAMQKAELSNKKLVAQQRGNMREAADLQKQIDEIERTADRLDKKRSQDIMAIAYINQRNRNKVKDELLSGRFKMEPTQADDPFTRKNEKMKVVSGTKSAVLKEAAKEIQSIAESTVSVAAKERKEKKTAAPVKSKRVSGTLFDLHHSVVNMEFNIDTNQLRSAKRAELADVPIGGMSIPVPPAPTTSAEAKPRGLSLEEYRRRRAAAAVITGPESME